MSNDIQDLDAELSWVGSWLDDLDTDLSFYLPIHLTLIGRLPTELHLKVAEHLDNADVCRLALVCSRFRTVAEDQLYRSINLSFSYQNTVPNLYRTLSGRQDLALRVNELKVRTLDEYVSLKLPTLPTFPHASPNAPSIKVRILAANIVGFILHLVSNVQTLTLSITDQRRSSGWDQETWDQDEWDDDGWGKGSGAAPSSEPLRHLFGPDFDVGKEDLALTTGFNNLTTLHLEHVKVEWALCKLPGLNRLILGNDCRIVEDWHPNEVSALKSLEFMWGLGLLIPEHTQQHECLKPFLDHFPFLSHIKIRILPGMDCVQGVEYLNESDQGSYEAVAHVLGRVSPTLETLDFGYNDIYQEYHLSFVFPIGSLTHFTRLKTLKIASEALIKGNKTSMENILPPSLETLEVWYPTLESYDMLDAICEKQDAFASLRYIKFQCANARGLRYEEIMFIDRHYDYYRVKLGRVGISFDTACHEHERNANWVDENYDPATMKLYEFMSTLDCKWQPERNMGGWA